MNAAELKALAERLRDAVGREDVLSAFARFRDATSPANIIALVERLENAEAFIAKPTKHRFWRPGEADCPRDIKADNGELHTLRCKVCGEDDPRVQICRAAYFDAPAGEGEG